MPKTGQIKHTKESLAYELKHGEQVTREDYSKYKESFVAGKESYDLTKPLSFKDYRDMALFRGKRATENADLETVFKTGLDPEKYRAKKVAGAKRKATPKGMADRKKASTKNNLSGGGMPTKNYMNPVKVIDNRRNK